MNILVLCDRYPFPLENGQNLRIYHYVSTLKGKHNFDLLCYGESTIPPLLVPLFRRVKVFPKPPKQVAAGLRRVYEAFSISRMIPGSSAVLSHLQNIAQHRDYDAIWVSGWGMVVNLPRPFSLPMLADVIDDGVLEFWNELKASRAPKQFLKTLKLLAMNYFFERKYFQTAQQCLFVSEVDAAMFQRISPKTPTTVIHNGVDADFFKPSGIESRPFSIVFEGKIGFKPNTDGILYFCQSILPLVRQALPETKLAIVGKDPPAEVKALACDYITVTGYVDDVRPYVDQAAVFVCPLRKGAGIKNKILQAWAMGKPVVATSNSIGGLLVRDGENIFVRDEPESFAEAVVTLLSDASLRARMGEASRRTVLDHYSWQSKAAELEKLFELIAPNSKHRNSKNA